MFTLWPLFVPTKAMSDLEFHQRSLANSTFRDLLHVEGESDQQYLGKIKDYIHTQVEIH